MLCDLKIEYNNKTDSIDIIAYQGDEVFFTLIDDTENFIGRTFTGSFKQNFDSNLSYPLIITVENPTTLKILITNTDNIPTSPYWVTKWKHVKENYIFYYFDIQDNSNKKTILSGRIYFNPQVTRS
jgi:hypothetical protein